MHRNVSNSTLNISQANLFTYLIVMGPVIMLLVYAGWIVFILKRIFHQKNKLKELKTNNFHGQKTTFLKYKYTTEYYKNLLILSTIITENLTFLPAILDIVIKAILPTWFITLDVTYVLRGISYVASLVTLCMLNTITIYMIYVSLRYTDFSEIKKRIKKVTIMACVLFFVSLIGLGLLSQIFCTIRGLIEFVYLVKNTKYLYSLFVEQYRNQISEGSYQIYRAQKFATKIFKWFSVSILTGMLIALIGLILEVPFSTLVLAFIIGKVFKKTIFYGRLEQDLISYRWVVRLTLLLSAVVIFLTIIVYSVYLVLRSYRILKGRKNRTIDELETSLI